TECHRAQKVRSADLKLLPNGQCGGHDCAARMRSARSVIVIAFVGMGQLPVGESRVHGAAEGLGGANRGALLPPAISPGELDRIASWRQLRSRDHGGDRVQNMV